MCSPNMEQPSALSPFWGDEEILLALSLKNGTFRCIQCRRNVDSQLNSVRPNSAPFSPHNSISCGNCLKLNAFNPPTTNNNSIGKEPFVPSQQHNQTQAAKQKVAVESILTSQYASEKHQPSINDHHVDFLNNAYSLYNSANFVNPNLLAFLGSYPSLAASMFLNTARHSQHLSLDPTEINNLTPPLSQVNNLQSSGFSSPLDFTRKAASNDLEPTAEASRITKSNMSGSQHPRMPKLIPVKQGKLRFVEKSCLRSYFLLVKSFLPCFVCEVLKSVNVRLWADLG